MPGRGDRLQRPAFAGQQVAVAHLLVRPIVAVGAFLDMVAGRAATGAVRAAAGDRRAGLQAGSFVALGYIAFGSAAGTLRCSLAGQPPPLLRREAASIETLCMPNHRLPLGALKLGGHRVLEIDMHPGDLLLAYSDGVVEAQSPDGELFGEERLARVLAGSPAGSPQAAIDHVLAQIETFTSGRTPYDDVTLLAARRTAG